MADNLKSKGPQDSSRINVNEDYEVRYWTKALGITEEELKKAVSEAGTSAEKVRTYLNNQR